MNQATINLRIDADLKKELDSILREMGMNITTAFTIFAKKVARERRIPFEITAPDPFYSEENMKTLVGHTPLEVMGGVIVGLCVSLLLMHL